MSPVQDYIEEIFEEFEENEEINSIKQNILNEQQKKYDALIIDGLSCEKALLKIKIDFGTKECILHRINEQRSMSHYIKFKHLYPKLKKWGLFSLLIITVFAMTLAGTTNLKLESLFLWVTVIILLVLFEIVVEYIDYWYENRYSFILPEEIKIQKRAKRKHEKKQKKHMQNYFEVK